MTHPQNTKCSCGHVRTSHSSEGCLECNCKKTYMDQTPRR